ncbi:MAG: DUF4368 domain-containing protein [Oscillospiraceae bacterium]|nr:DUF4368 domain-containing protein [Oscillospiraceae bacterium]
MLKKSGAEDDSNSIQNQRLLLEKYAKEKGFPNTKFIYDDGYSGTNFRRPGWNEVMELVESDQVATIIVKDMSRLGREYLQVGQYTELIFPSYGIRFIAVNDGVDSLYESTNDFVPFRNLMNEFYAKDCSKKGRSAARVKAETGARVGSRPPYGYQKDPDDPKRRIIPDPDTAPIVQRIFALCASGSGPSQIAKLLTSEKVPTPSYAYYAKYGVEIGGANIEEPYNWSGPTVSAILENEAYLGNTVNLKYTTLSFKNKKKIERPQSEQFRFENTHVPLVDVETWKIVQEIRQHKRRRTNMDEQDMFSGLVYCADCGSTMTLSRAHTMKECQYNFTCQNHRKNGKDVCSPHYIRESVLAAVVLDDVRRITHFARQNEVLFAKHIGMKRSKESQREIAALQKRIDAMTKRDAELTALFKRLYEDNVLGRIPDEQYRVLSNEYLAEQNAIREELPKAQERQQVLRDSVSNVARFIDKAKKYETIDELTPEILRTFIKRIEVGEREKKYSRNAPQDITIYYRDVGAMDELPQQRAEEEESAKNSQEIA